VVQYLKNPPSRAQLGQDDQDAGTMVRSAVRTREAAYDELNLAAAGDDGLLDAMAELPILIAAAVLVPPRAPRARPIDAVSRDFCEVETCAAAVALVGARPNGCGSETPDYHSVWSTSITPPPIHPPTRRQCRSPSPRGRGVTGESIALDKLTISGHDAAPKGWQQYPSRTRAGNAVTPMRHLPHRDAGGVELTGDFERQRGHKHGYPTPNCRRTSSGATPPPTLHGFPSSMIEAPTTSTATYHSYNRISSPPAPRRRSPISVRSPDRLCGKGRGRGS